MKLDIIVPYLEMTPSHNEIVTLREVLVATSWLTYAGEKQLEIALSTPAETVARIGTEAEHQYCPALLFCGDIYKHQNGSEYVLALRSKGRSQVVVEKYWLDDPILPTASLALLE